MLPIPLVHDGDRKAQVSRPDLPINDIDLLIRRLLANRRVGGREHKQLPSQASYPLSRLATARERSIESDKIGSILLRIPFYPTRKSQTALVITRHKFQIFKLHRGCRVGLNIDRQTRELCQQEFPDARLFRRFRRQNRDLLQRALTTALGLSLPPELPNAVVLEEAKRRIGTAMFIDSMESAD